MLLALALLIVHAQGLALRRENKGNQAFENALLEIQPEPEPQKASSKATSSAVPDYLRKSIELAVSQNPPILHVSNESDYRGVPIIHKEPTNGSLSAGEALRRASFMDPEVNAKLRSGDLEYIHVDNETMQEFANIAGVPFTTYYEYAPIGRDMSKKGELPFIVSPKTKAALVKEPSSKYQTLSKNDNASYNIDWSSVLKYVDDSTENAWKPLNSYKAWNASQKGIDALYRTMAVWSSKTVTTVNESAPVPNYFFPQGPSGNPTINVTSVASLAFPSLDGFYSPPQSRIDDYTEGSVLSFRRVDFEKNKYPEGTEMIQMLFRTRDAQADSLMDVATILKPAKPNGYLVAYQQHDNSNSQDCATSFSLATGLVNSKINKLLSLGYTVTVTDYEGTKSAYGAFSKGAYAVLDSIRASQSLARVLGFDVAQVFMYGFSSGASVTLKAAELATTYVPSLVLGDSPVIKGVVAGGPIVDLTRSFERWNNGTWAGLISMATLGVSYENDGLSMYLEKSLVDGQNSGMYYSNTTCQAPTITNFLGHDIYSLFTEGSDFYKHPLVHQAFSDQSIGQANVTVPLLVFTSTSDELTDVKLVDKLMDRYCEGGSHAMYLRHNSARSHLQEEHIWDSAALSFFSSIREGHTPDQCASHKAAIIKDNYGSAP